jgi:hypothetical protein
LKDPYIHDPSLEFLGELPRHLGILLEDTGPAREALYPTWREELHPLGEDDSIGSIALPVVYDLGVGHVDPVLGAEERNHDSLREELSIPRPEAGNVVLDTREEHAWSVARLQHQIIVHEDDLARDDDGSAPGIAPRRKLIGFPDHYVIAVEVPVEGALGTLRPVGVLTQDGMLLGNPNRFIGGDPLAILVVAIISDLDIEVLGHPLERARSSLAELTEILWILVDALILWEEIEGADWLDLGITDRDVLRESAAKVILTLSFIREQASRLERTTAEEAALDIVGVVLSEVSLRVAHVRLGLEEVGIVGAAVYILSLDIGSGEEEVTVACAPHCSSHPKGNGLQVVGLPVGLPDPCAEEDFLEDASPTLPRPLNPVEVPSKDLIGTLSGSSLGIGGDAGPDIGLALAAA